MVFRVDNKPVDGRQGLQSPLEVRRTEQPQTQPSQPAAKPGSAAEVSSISAKLVAVEKELSANAPYDRKRVDALRQQIRDGNYKINVDNISGRIVDSAIAYSRNKH
jgi:flagellar biosynthesis anti-sigma factor FlgM